MVNLIDVPDVQDALDELEDLRRKATDENLNLTGTILHRNSDEKGIRSMISKKLSTIESSSSDDDDEEEEDEESDEVDNDNSEIVFPKKRNLYHRPGSGTTLNVRKNLRNKGNPYPPACLFFLKLFPENDTCMDCGEYNPSFAFSTFGVLLCSMCSSSIDHVESDEGNILSLYTLDQWDIRTVLSTLIGGNKTMKFVLETEIDFTAVTTTNSFDIQRYSSDAAQRYRKNLESRVEEILQGPPISEDIFKPTTYWIAKYQPPNLFRANHALLALSATSTASTNTTRSSTATTATANSRPGLVAAMNQSRRASFQAMAKPISFTRRTSNSSLRSSIASLLLFDASHQRTAKGTESSTNSLNTNTITSSTAVGSSTTTMMIVPSAAEDVTLVSRQSFPPECLFFLRLLPQNDRCLDCGDFNPQFANTNFGILLCLHCSEKHCQIGFQVCFSFFFVQ